ncbi:hypothetical protein RJ639_042317 [Escallonia herrerae]|uniref:PAS domain-containing protein n=1 Tax=Escallonia herrerae TaxID=1293975 RepID=A0AA88WM18_9ASTE|nr:hypothetical protein RJ639_042317 [Escallonia herrerae]
MNSSESQEGHYRFLADRYRSMEASHDRLKRQLSSLAGERGSAGKLRGVVTSGSGEVTSCAGWAWVPGVFVRGSRYRSVLESMGHAVHVSRAGNRAAEKLYGYKEHEVLGQRVPDLHMDEEHHVSEKKIMEKLSHGEPWSGQFLCRKRSGEVFMALVTKSLCHEDDELLGVITVSSDAAVCNNINSENLRTQHDRDNGQRRVWGLNLKKVQWHQPPQIASMPQIVSSVSNLNES